MSKYLLFVFNKYPNEATNFNLMKLFVTHPIKSWIKSDLVKLTSANFQIPGFLGHILIPDHPDIMSGSKDMV